MTRPRLLLGLAAVTLVAAALALLANGVFAAERGLERGESARPAFHVRVAETLLGSGDDRALLRVLELVRASRVPGTPSKQALELHARAEAELARLSRESGDAALRSAAANLTGILLLEDARLDPASARRFQELGLEAFRTAVRLDPGSDAAKFNLELLLTELGRHSGQRASGGIQGEEGAGAAPEGSGF